MNLYFIIPIIILLFIVVFLIYNEIENRKLLKTVTSLDRGTSSERKMVLRILKSGIKSTAIFHDLYLNNGNEQYSQIDIVVATKVGIIVFEVKEYSGWIFGSENQVNWTQLLAYGKQKYKFYNPILQNKKHIEDLRRVYNFDDIPIYSLIVFFGNCTLKNPINLPHGTYLTKSNSVMEWFNNILEKQKLVRYGNQWDIANFLKQAVENGESSIIREKHLNNIQRLKFINKSN
ncbi:nuclease-related domain-containing protein [Chishuiella sp.]|uniref:nuclease-related domain-containing protein n=1 Tax=Chishuiella sp. TaxID=1969467 RepID=UPI0028B164C0|nr:nuclease-related domain-containing protein [Chishuiella sp.]